MGKKLLKHIQNKKMTQEKLEEYNLLSNKVRFCKARVKALDVSPFNEDVDSFNFKELLVGDTKFRGDAANKILEFAKLLANEELDKAERDFKNL